MSCSHVALLAREPGASPLEHACRQFYDFRRAAAAQRERGSIKQRERRQQQSRAER
jgi:hypothetical protein